MTTQEVINAGITAAPYAGALVGGVLLQRIFNVVSLVAGFFASKPDVVPALLETINDLKKTQIDQQEIMQDILAVLAALKGAQANAPKSN